MNELDACAATCLGVKTATFAGGPLPRTLTAGFVDLHVHTAPDVYGRSLDDDEAATAVKHAQMGGLVLKNHVAETASRAELVFRRHGVEAWGGVVLNRSVGGLNPVAVDTVGRIEGGRGRIVWLPTVDSQNHRRTLENEDDGIPVFKNGKPVPELERVIRTCADYHLGLCTGHTAADEALLVAEMCRDAGVRCAITHALFPIIGFTEQHVAQAAELGAMVELCAIGALMGERAHLPWMRTWGNVDAATCAGYVTKFGPEHFIVSTDFGQSGNPSPVDGLRRFVDELSKAGLGERERTLIGRDNPRRLLGV